VKKIYQRRGMLGLFLAAAALVVMPVQAQNFPTKPIRMVLAVTPGGTIDILARIVCQHLTAKLGQPCIVDNRPGGSGAIGTNFVAKSAPDGYTLFLMGSSQSTVEAAAISGGKERPFDTLGGLTGVSLLVTNPYVLAVHPSLPVKNAKEFIALARSKPGAIVYGSSGIGRTDHVAGEMFAYMTGIKLLHVPYKGVGPVVTALLSGEVQAAYTALPPMLSYVQAGRLRVLGLVGGSRTPLMPELPTLAEAVPLKGYKVGAWMGLMAPKGTPKPVVDLLNRELVQMVKSADFARQAVQPHGLDPIGSSPEELTDLLRTELDLYTRLFKDTGIKLE
jgi:tripartite-type tricarboxylate transporter receptor subunit TctC